MKSFAYYCLVIALVLAGAALTNAQSVDVKTTHFEVAGAPISFDYPSDWTLSDASVDEMKYLTLTSADKNAQIGVVAQRDPGISCASESRSKNVTRAFIAQLATQIHATSPLPTTSVPLSVGANEVQAIKFDGLHDGKPITALVIGSIINKWFVNLVLVKPVGDDTSLPAWGLVRSSFYVAEPALTASSKIGQNDEVLNAKALKLARPEYPVEARDGRANGVVLIDVEIDELGNVTLACVRKGHPLLREVTLDAARKSKFSATKMGEKPIRTGVIQYNFVSQ
jgi:hypothetical protein